MSELSQLSPQPLWDIFAKICSIPHPSYHEEQLAEHIVSWAKEKGLYVDRDQVGNILIRKPATAGMEIASRSFYRRIWIWCRKK